MQFLKVGHEMLGKIFPVYLPVPHNVKVSLIIRGVTEMYWGKTIVLSIKFPREFLGDVKPYEIGSGQNGVVYRVTNNDNGEKLALKYNYCDDKCQWCPKSDSGTPICRQCTMIEKEFEFLEQNKENPWLITPHKKYDLEPIDPKDPTRYCGFTMEVCSGMGGSVGELSFYKAQLMAKDLGRGLMLLHAKGYDHGDVRSPNIVYCKDDDVYKLIDPVGGYIDLDKTYHGRTGAQEYERLLSRDIHMLGYTLYEFYNYVSSNYYDVEWLDKDEEYYMNKIDIVREKLKVDLFNVKDQEEFNELWFKHFLSTLMRKNYIPDLEEAFKHPFITGEDPCLPEFEIGTQTGATKYSKFRSADIPSKI